MNSDALLPSSDDDNESTVVQAGHKMLPGWAIGVLVTMVVLIALGVTLGTVMYYGTPYIIASKILRTVAWDDDPLRKWSAELQDRPENTTLLFDPDEVKNTFEKFEFEITDDGPTANALDADTALARQIFQNVWFWARQKGDFKQILGYQWKTMKKFENGQVQIHQLDFHDGQTMKRARRNLTGLLYFASPQVRWPTTRQTDPEELVVYFHGAGTPALKYLRAFSKCQAGGNFTISKNGKMKKFPAMKFDKRELSNPTFCYVEYHGYGDMYNPKLKLEPNDIFKGMLDTRYTRPSVEVLEELFLKLKLGVFDRIVLIGFSSGTMIVLRTFLLFLKHSLRKKLTEETFSAEVDQIYKMLFAYPITIKLCALVADFAWIQDMINFPTNDVKDLEGNAVDLIADIVKTLNELKLLCPSEACKDSTPVKLNVHVYHSAHDEFMNGLGDTMVRKMNFTNGTGHTVERFRKGLQDRKLVNPAKNSNNKDFPVDLELINVDDWKEIETPHAIPQPPDENYGHFTMDAAMYNI